MAGLGSFSRGHSGYAATEGDLKEEFLRYSPMVYSVALRILKSREDAEDVVQEIFSQKMPRLLAEHGRLPPANMGPLLARVARNHAIDIYRRRKHFVDQSPEDGGENRAEEDAEYRFAKVDAMEEAMRDMQPHYREVLTLKYLLRLGWAEVADRLGLSVQGARKRAEKAKDHLRGKLGEKEGEP